MRPIPELLAELETMNVAELVERFIEVFGRAPRTKQPVWLRRKIGYRLQEQRFGGLSATARARLEELIAEIDLPLEGGRAERAKLEPRSRRNETTLGTTVVRAWKDREIRATAVEGGWEHDGSTFRSLSAVAKHVTGAHWNGKHFFGLTPRRKAR